MNELARLKAERDALDAHIKLVEDGIRKGAENASYSAQLVTINEARERDGKPKLTMSQFASGTFAEVEHGQG